MRVGFPLYRYGMMRLLRDLSMACVMALTAMAIMLSPTNAVAMLACNLGEAVVSAHEYDTHHAEIALHDVADEYGNIPHASTAEHCVSHSCVFALSGADVAGIRESQLHSLTALIPDGSVVDLSIPEGLRRPPRS